MGRARVSGVAALVATAAGTSVALVAGRRLVRPGGAGPDGAQSGRLDLLAVAVLLLGLAVAVGGVTVALVALADRALGRLEQEAPVPRPDSGDETAGTPRTGDARRSSSTGSVGAEGPVRPSDVAAPVSAPPPARPRVGGVEEAPTVAATRVDPLAIDPSAADRPTL